MLKSGSPSPAWAKGMTLPGSGSGRTVKQPMRNENGHVLIRHPATVGPDMMAPRADYAESPSGSLTSTPPGGIMGGLAPTQNAKGATNADFDTGKHASAKTWKPVPATY